MPNPKLWLSGLYFSTPPYFNLIIFIYGIFLFLSVILTFKLIYRPRKSKHSQYRIFGHDSIWGLLMILCSIAIIALAGPKVMSGYTLKHGGNVDVLIWMDDSFSMRANDIKPSRQEVAKRAAIELAGILRDGDRITLFIFGDNVRWRMPLSEDFKDFTSKINEIEQPEVYQEESQLNTDFINAIEYAPKCLDKQRLFAKNNLFGLGSGNPDNNYVGIFFSDGNNEMDGSLALGINELKKMRIKVYTVGIGTRAGTEVNVLIGNQSNQSGHPKKNKIKTSLSTKDLKTLASGTGGEFFVFDSEKLHPWLTDFLKNAINSNRSALPRLVYSNTGHDIWWEILAIPSVVLLLLSIWRR